MKNAKQVVSFFYPIKCLWRTDKLFESLNKDPSEKRSEDLLHESVLLLLCNWLHVVLDYSLPASSSAWSCRRHRELSMKQHHQNN